MANLTDPIVISAQELIRDQITLILTEELPEQATLLSDPDVNAKVCRERFKPVNYTEMPLVNVLLQRRDSSKQNVTARNDVILYMIDIYTKAEEDENGNTINGDEFANIKNQKIERVISGILSSTFYRRLNINVNMVQSVNITAYTPTELQDNQDSESTSAGRLQIEVKATDENLVEAAIALQKATQEAELGTSGKKHTWIWDKI